MKKILIVDTDMDMCILLERFFSKNNFLVKYVRAGKKAIQELNEFYPDIVISDFRLVDFDGKELLQQIKSINPQLPVIIMTNYSDVKIAVDVMKLGAYDFVLKPLFPEEILITVSNALKGIAAISNHLPELASILPLRGHNNPHDYATTKFIFSESVEFSPVLKQMELVAPTNYSVIIYGESGSGKEGVALEIHLKSVRAKAPFIPIDCGTLTRELAASELFGHEKGSFTGAIGQKIGSLESANGGTVFLDEVANLCYEVQVSLLRVVQERKIRRVGGKRDIEIDIRIIVASNEQLWEMSQQGKFREDLFHRFNEFSINLPSLRNRKSDLAPLSMFFLAQANQELGKNINGFTPEVMQIFLQYHWPGNLRELKNVIKRAALLELQNSIQVDSLPLELLNQTKNNHIASANDEYLALHHLSFILPETDLKIHRINAAINIPTEDAYSLKEASIGVEYEMIVETIKQVNNNKSKAAKLLNIDRKTLYNKMKLYKVYSGQ